MPDNIHPIGAAQGSYLATVTLYRRADGRITAALEDMALHEIDNEETITARFVKQAAWMVNGAIDFMRQAVRFDDETRAANAEDQA